MKHCAMIRAAIIGLGRWGRSLVAAVAGKSDDIRFVEAYTRTRAAAEEFCREKSIALVDSYDEILRNPDIDAVVLATPHSQHQAQALAAAAARKHIFVEKPLTLDRKSAHAVADAAQKAGLVLAVGLTRRFHPSIAELRARARDGGLGSIIAMVAQHTTSTAQFVAPGNWRASAEEAPGGAFTAVGVHALDHMIEFAGRVRDVRCVTARTYPGPSDDTTTIMLRFASGATGLLFCSVATATNFEFTVYGSKGLAEISRPDLSRFRYAPTATVAPTGLVPAPPDEIVDYSGFDMLYAEVSAFARAIRDGEAYPVSVADVLHGMAVFDAVIQSAKSGAIVAVAD
jgi:predicted dehydrogenase